MDDPEFEYRQGLAIIISYLLNNGLDVCYSLCCQITSTSIRTSLPSELIELTLKLTQIFGINSLNLNLRNAQSVKDQHRYSFLLSLNFLNLNLSNVHFLFCTYVGTQPWIYNAQTK